MTVPVLIVIAGLCIMLAGVVLAWRKTGTGTWAAFLFGIALVIVGGPLSPRLGNLSLNQQGLNVSLIPDPLSNKPVNPSDDIPLLRNQLVQASKDALAAITSVQTQVDEMRQQMKAIADRTGSLPSTTEQLAKIDDVVAESRAHIESAKDRLDWAAVRVQINDLLPKYADICKELKSKGVPTGDTFGSTSVTPTKPKVFVLAFGQGVSAKHIRLLTDSLLPYGLQALDYSSKDLRDRRVYIGSYDYNGALIDKDLLSVVHDITLDESSIITNIEARRKKLVKEE